MGRTISIVLMKSATLSSWMKQLTALSTCSHYIDQNVDARVASILDNNKLPAIVVETSGKGGNTTSIRLKIFDTSTIPVSSPQKQYYD